MCGLFLHVEAQDEVYTRVNLLMHYLVIFAAEKWIHLWNAIFLPIKIYYPNYDSKKKVFTMLKFRRPFTFMSKTDKVVYPKTKINF